MSPRVRKLVGSVGVLVFLGFYIWAATAVAERLPDSTVVQLVFFALAGTLWGLPLFPLIAWVQRGR